MILQPSVRRRYSRDVDYESVSWSSKAEMGSTTVTAIIGGSFNPQGPALPFRGSYQQIGFCPHRLGGGRASPSFPLYLANTCCYHGERACLRP
ncbi:hypothetical protein AVEN_259355-1 [Araneus ventricosus]|uniref:Uncharacterized protein n=1 Tax=Araneus ventricosus TaxID=182803 RepID=A0A4Y2DTL5_ARAVE|nr:hypothetical protein AVEN_259355-1 [Araneus ventricosus]